MDLLLTAPIFRPSSEWFAREVKISAVIAAWRADASTTLEIRVGALRQTPELQCISIGCIVPSFRIGPTTIASTVAAACPVALFIVAARKQRASGEPRFVDRP